MLLAVAGMVGVGKSTLTTSLAQALGLCNIPESVGEKNPWLDLFYGVDEGDGRYNRYALPLDLHFLASRLETMREAVGSGLIIDRTWYEDAEIFAKRRFDTGRMDQNEYSLYQRLYSELLHVPAATPPVALVYLEAPLETVLTRIRERGRASEQGMPESYWADLHARYEHWVSTFTVCPIVRVDVRDYDLKMDPAAISPIVRKLLTSLEPHVTRQLVLDKELDLH